jgi:hypothetical protein
LRLTKCAARLLRRIKNPDIVAFSSRDLIVRSNQAG